MGRRDLDYGKIYDSMVKSGFIFDGHNIVDHKRLFDLGFNVYPLGKYPLTRI